MTGKQLLLHGKFGDFAMFRLEHATPYPVSNDLFLKKESMKKNYYE